MLQPSVNAHSRVIDKNLGSNGPTSGKIKVAKKTPVNRG